VAVALNPYKVQTLHAQLGGATLVLEVADTEALQSKGLSGRTALQEGEGMLFVFPEDGQHGFWMKDMQFSIDIVWLDSSYRVVDVKKDATPVSYPEIFTPASPARYVVEIPAGFFNEHHLKTGDTLEIL
jgi:hypothetical protein